MPSLLKSVIWFRNNNPDKGTETINLTSAIMLNNAVFRNNNPDKGTETRRGLPTMYKRVSLEIITPIRGRKHVV